MRDLIAQCWREIGRADKEVIRGDGFSLVNVKEYLAYFGLSPLGYEIGPSKGFRIPCAVAPSFRNLTDEILLSLWYCLHRKENLTTVIEWAEKLMRFCEVRYRDVKRVATEKCGSKELARKHLLKLTAFFSDLANTSGDPRYVNIALKLAEQRWIVDGKRLKRELTAEGDELICALYGFRVLLTLEYAIGKIESGGM